MSSYAEPISLKLLIAANQSNTSSTPWDICSLRFCCGFQLQEQAKLCYRQAWLQFEAFIFLICWKIPSSYCICLDKWGWQRGCWTKVVYYAFLNPIRMDWAGAVKYLNKGSKTYKPISLYWLFINEIWKSLTILDLRDFACTNCGFSGIVFLGFLV